MDADLAAFWGMVPRYYHISKMLFIPYVPTFHDMDVVTDPKDLTSANPFGEEVALKDEFDRILISLF